MRCFHAVLPIKKARTLGAFDRVPLRGTARAKARALLMSVMISACIPFVFRGRTFWLVRGSESAD